jgi:GT2 family glycosyltransferase
VYCPDGPRPEVSAIVPLYRSARVVERCLRSLMASLPPGSEIIVVDDASPDRAGELAARVLADFERGLVVRLSRNTGYAHANNVGAGVARGRYLLLFNADAYAEREGFLEPMLRLLEENPDAAVVGNRHVTPGGRVDSEGSEFSWRAKTYQHVGRDIADPVGAHGQREPQMNADGRRLNVLAREAPPSISVHLRSSAVASDVKERDMVTFACALVRRASWDELGGLDERYARAYFEDSDLCMRVRSRGWRVLYTPASEIVHVGRHSQAGNGSHYRANARLFHRRWVHTGMVDRFRRGRLIRAHEGRIVVCMIACSEAEFIAAALESVYPLADRIVVVEGGNQHAVRAGLCDAKGRSTDGTREEITRFVDERDPERKVLAVTRDDRPWRDKNEMREAYATELRPGDWMLLLDADEVFTEEGLWRMSALMHEADVVCPGFHLFWNDLATLGTGRWDDFPQVKAVRWRKGLTYLRDHNMPCDSRGVAVTAIKGARVVRTRERLYCHYSWAGKSDGKLARKARYYVEQNGPAVFPPDWFERVFLAWRDDPERIEREFGTHPYGGGGTEPFAGEHPGPVRRRMESSRREGAEV